jgi:hypothetical protein
MVEQARRHASALLIIARELIAGLQQIILTDELAPDPSLAEQRRARSLEVAIDVRPGGLDPRESDHIPQEDRAAPIRKHNLEADRLQARAEERRVSEAGERVAELRKLYGT